MTDQSSLGEFGPSVFANNPSTRANGFSTSNTNAMNISTPDNNPYNPPMFNATNTNLPTVDFTGLDPFLGISKCKYHLNQFSLKGSNNN